MALYRILAKDATKLKPIELYNPRSFQWTDTRNKAGPANFTLDNTPTSRQLRAGWQIEIIRDGSIVYWGKVMKRTVKINNIKIFCIDSSGLTNKRTLQQRAVTLREASTEVKLKLDGLQLDTGIVLSADSFIQPTNTIQKWHWEGNSLLNYIVDIGESVNNLANKSVPYFLWIDARQNVQFLPDGKAGFYKDLPLKNITLQEDIESTYNAITVEGNPVNIIPYDKDFWTENGNLDSWGLDGGSEVFSYEKENAMIGGNYIRVSEASGIERKASKYITQNRESSYNFENVDTIVFWLRPQSGATVNTMRVQLNDGTDTRTYNWESNKNYDSTVPISNVWKEWTWNLTTNYTETGSFDITKVQYFTIIVNFSSGVYYYDLDGLYFTLDIYSYTAIDQSSINKHGRLEKSFISRSYYSNSECEVFAETLLEYHKNAKTTFNASLDGYVRLIPNSTIEFEFEGEKFNKAITSVTHYVTVNGAESCQLTMGDFKKHPIDEILEKFAEINRNYNLLENPYKIA